MVIIVSSPEFENGKTYHRRTENREAFSGMHSIRIKGMQRIAKPVSE